MAANKLHALVVGAGGLVGGELLRLLSLHPEIARITALSRSYAGRPAHEAHRSLRHLPRIEMVDKPAQEAAKDADIIFCALPHGQSQKIMEDLLSAAPPLIIDLAADFRLRDAAQFQKYYGTHCCPALAQKFTYGLPEHFGDALRQSRAIANPGCFATAAELLLLPLAIQRLLPPSTAVFAVTGSSGSGALPKASAHHPFRAENFFSYKMLAHQHEGEINQTLTKVAGEESRVRLLSHSGPFVRGIHATAYLAGPDFADLDVAALYRDTYDERCPFVAVLDEPPLVAEVAGTNFVHIHVAQQGDEIEIALAMDNLMKGAAGQAIQNMNLALGFDESAGLTNPGVFPC
jgi:N-acetyl-gamma-glutamyl-phosphate reductase common form